ncbi:site-2 protease family protein [uncultured Tenacibaculum sp.]|uniref:site-2 protease family protein n=1 Tax=uncultured Tenacibaculum sp. TaxID=174713 RepID=UPI002606A046|nr:site-2 protease family protein [uncultured Tenacibaculum sp.]
MIDSSITYKEIEKFVNDSKLIHNDEKYILVYLDKIYYIREFLFDFFNTIKRENYSTAVQKIKSDQNLSEEEVTVLNESVVSLVSEFLEEKEEKKYIKFSIPLIKEPLVNKVSDKLKFLFKDTILYTLLIISSAVISSVFFFDVFNFKILEISSNNTTFSLIVILSILLFHEFGHAAASSYFNIRPKEIGFGFYLIFPVFFANVSKIWVLKKKERILVNLGGIYFQLIVNNVLFLLLFLFPSNSSFILGIMKINVFVALYSLTPFIRNDGYWVFSDFFDIQNLNKKANSFPYLLYVYLFKNERESLSIPLVLYSIGNYIFLYLIISKFIIGAPQIFHELFALYEHNSINEIVTNHFEILFKVLITVFFLYLIAKSIVTWMKDYINREPDKVIQH